MRLTLMTPSGEEGEAMTPDPEGMKEDVRQWHLTEAP